MADAPLPPRQSSRGWNELVEPWLGQSIGENARVFIDTGEAEQTLRGRVVRDGSWVHIQTAVERLSVPSGRVNAIEWETLTNA